VRPSGEVLPEVIGGDTPNQVEGHDLMRVVDDPRALTVVAAVKATFSTIESFHFGNLGVF
jgi:hypothetical protein